MRWSWLVLGLALVYTASGQNQYVDQNGKRHLDTQIQLLPGNKVQIQSEGFPKRAPARFVQYWNIKAPTGNQIRLNCYTIGLPANPDGSCHDYIFRMKDGPRDVQDLCGGVYGLSKLSNGNILELTLFTGNQDAGLIDCYAEIRGYNPPPPPVQQTTTSRPTNSWRPPYLDQPSLEIDSSEHGGPPGTVPTTCPCGTANKNLNRIIGGGEARINEFPFAVMLILKGGYGPFCGGSIISNYHVLTAAHCVIKYRDYGISIVAGDHDYTKEGETSTRTVIDVSQVIMHEYYPGQSHYDIALLVLAKPVEYSRYINAVCIPHKPLNLDGQYLKALGWGRTSPYGSGSPYLKKANVRVVGLSVCKDYAGIEYNDPHQLCTFSRMKGLGKGDSGGPIVWVNKETNRYTLVGLPSFVYFYNDTNTLPDVSTDVSSFLPWIHQKMRATQPKAQACWASN